MGNYKQLKQAVSDVIKANGNHEITGAILQNALLTIISTVGENATFAGIAKPTTNPGTPDANIFYLAFEDGEYVNFGNISINEEVVILSNESGSWVKTNIDIAKKSDIGFNEVQRTIGIFVVWADGQLEINNGGVGSDSTWQHTDFIPIYGKVSFYTEVTVGNYYGICFYDANKSYIKKYINLSTYTNIVKKPNEEAAYVRFCNKKSGTPVPIVRINNEDENNVFKIINNILSQKYVPFSNLLEYIQYIGSENELKFAMNNNMAINHINGKEETNTMFELSDFIPVIEGVEYRFNATFGVYYGLLFYTEANKNSYIPGSGINNTYESNKIIAPVGSKFVRFSNNKNNKNPWFLIDGPFTTPPEYVEPKKYMILGASFASPQNTWFEQVVSKLGGTAINKASDGNNIILDANKLSSGTLYTDEELEDVEVLVIMHVHNKNVNDQILIQSNYTDYSLPFDLVYDDAHYSAAYDYVIKKYMADCYELKNKSTSKYYNTDFGKPCKIVFCTHWHDARVTYNAAIREVAAKFGKPLIEFDKNIGFSKEEPHSVTLQQVSILYANVAEYLGKTEIIDGVTYGWHPTRGEDAYIQQKMALIAYKYINED